MEMDLTNYLKKEDLKKQELKKIFFYRICGTGMGAAAMLLKEKGYEVSGFDKNFYPPMGDYLKNSGIKLYDKADFNLKDFDLIIVGNVVGKKSDDARMIEKTGTPFTSFPTALGALVLDTQNVVGVAGTHGKTSTTYLLVQIFNKLGFDPGYLIGGVLPKGPSSHLGDGSYFFIEADEYDSSYFEKFSKFRSYEIDHLMLTSLEFDHADIFKGMEEIKDQFRSEIPKLKNPIIANMSYPALRELREEFGGDWVELVLPKDLKMHRAGSEFSLRGETYKTNLVGHHNILNLISALLFALDNGISADKLKTATYNLNLVKRRQEVRGYYKGSMVIDDFAHHPRAVKMTYEAISTKYPKQNIVVVLEPASATARSNIFQSEFAHALKEIPQVILAKPQTATTVEGSNNLDCYQLAAGHGNASVVEDLTALRSALDKLAQDNSLFLILSNSTCLGLWESDFVKHLKSM
ncbi:MAG: hypothetical protein DRQ88_07635 [Epsilonproteobacteria bacterium]|nr:MAG: hypothetical protein DRQ88_07635 [Campylobacterota bacterium]